MAESGVCTKCGAALPPADALGLITCPGCGSVTKLPGSTPTLDDRPEPTPPPAPTPAPAPSLGGWPAPPVAAPPPGGQWSPPAGVAGAPTTAPPSSGPKKGKGKGGSQPGRKIGCAIVPIAILVVVAMGIVGAVRSCDIETFTTAVTNTDFDSSMLTLSGSGTVLPSTGEDTDVVMVLQDTEDSQTTRHIARIRFSGDESELLWQSEALDESAFRAEVALVGDTLFAGVDSELYALDPETGATKWKTTLRDKLTAGCPECFGGVRGRLVVRTTDAYLTTYGTRSSEPLWSKRLVSTSGSMSIVGDRLFVVDEAESDDTPTPILDVDPANGRTIRSTTPRCPKTDDTPWELTAAPGDLVRAVPGSGDVLAVFGFGDVCVVRWDPATGATRWTSRLSGLGSTDEDEILIGERDLVLGTTGEPIVDVYLPNGKARVLDAAAGADLNATPTLIVGRTLLALTVTTRGTPKGGMAAWDLSTGERTWANAALGTAQPVSTSRYHGSDALFEGTPRSLLVPVGDGVNVFVFEGTEGERTFTVAPVDLATGDLGTEIRRPYLTRYDSGTVSLTVEGQQAGRLVVSIDNLLQTIPVSGKGDIVSFPEKN